MYSMLKVDLWIISAFLNKSTRSEVLYKISVLKNFINSQETPVQESFFKKIQIYRGTSVFLDILWKFSDKLLRRASPDDHVSFVGDSLTIFSLKNIEYNLRYIVRDLIQTQYQVFSQLYHALPLVTSGSFHLVKKYNALFSPENNNLTPK